VSGPLDFPEGESQGGPAPRRELPPPPPPARPPGASRYGWFVGVIVVLVLAYILYNTLHTPGQGAGGLPAGEQLPPFAAPLVLSDLDGDVNLATKPNNGSRGRQPACSVRGPRVVNSCALGHGRPLVVGFLFTRGAKCSPAFDAMERARRRHPEVSFAGIVVRGGRDDARKLVREHGWGFPIGYDRDGGLSNLYGIAGCPEFVLAYPGGRVRETAIGKRAVTELARRVDALVAAARRRGWRPPA
jgi:hypothetical protein